ARAHTPADRRWGCRGGYRRWGCRGGCGIPARAGNRRPRCARTAHRRARCRTCRHGCRWWSWPACADPARHRDTHAPVPDCRLTSSGCSEKAQVTNLIMYSSPTGPRTTWPLRIRPLACDQAAVPGQQRTRRDQPMRAQHSWQPPGQDRPVGPVRLRSVDLTPEHRDLVPEHDDLRVLGRLAAAQQHEPAEYPDGHQVEQTKSHEPRSWRNQLIQPNRSSQRLRRVLKRYRPSPRAANRPRDRPRHRGVLRGGPRGRPDPLPRRATAAVICIRGFDGARVLLPAFGRLYVVSCRARGSWRRNGSARRWLVTRMRASTAMTPSGRAITGLRSSSATCGSWSGSRDILSRVSRSAWMSAAGWPRCPSRGVAARIEWMRSWASAPVRGASRATRSPSSWVATPPSPNTTTGPNT